MKSAENKLELIKLTVQSVFPDSEVMLFGSRVYSDASGDSDYDILVIIKKKLSPKEKFPYRTEIRKELLNFGIRSDIIIQSREELNKNKKLPGHIIRRILTNAVLL